jgi:cytochrome c
MIIPLISGAFLLTYLHKYTWKKGSLSYGSHWLIGVLAAVLFLIIPFIFLANANLMLFPERWGEVKGFFSALLLPNIFSEISALYCGLHYSDGSLSDWLFRQE